MADARVALRLLSPCAVAILQSPQPRENPYERVRPEELVVAPVYDARDDNSFSYHPTRVRNGILAIRGALTNEESEALSDLDARLEEVAVDYLLEAGDIVMVDNCRFAHDRRAFVDDPDAPRLLERLWIG